MNTVTGKTAVVGMSGIFPGAGNGNLTQFCQNIMEKRESIMEVPGNRWLLPRESVLSSQYQPDTASSGRAGIVTGFEFDPHGFHIDKELLLQLDPLHHMVLHTGQEALSQCFHSSEILNKTGVVLAAIALPTEKSSDLAWQIIMEQKHKTGRLEDITPSDALACGMVSVPAALLARALGLGGGCFTLDAACASSLYAIKIACEQLHAGKNDMVIAGGVSRPDSLYTQIGFTQLKALSPTGKCSPFDKHANGLVVGEGAGIVVLKRLEDAVKCGDIIHCVISGAGWSNDIEGNLVAPASEGQIRAMESAYINAGWSPGDVQHIECHGSATPVGDNIELNSMATLWRNAGLGNQGCAIGSVKSMTGHLLTAAGATGFIKTVLALKEKRLPPSLNFSQPTDNSPLHTTGFHVQTEPEEWKPRGLIEDPSSIARRAGISAFGFGGINAHVLVEEFRPNTFSLSLAGTSSRNLHETGGRGPDVLKHGRSIYSDKPAVAIVGMESVTAAAPNLKAFREMIFKESSECPTLDRGLWMEEVSTHAGEFHIPPNQMEDILPQHLIMLKAAMGAIKDAGIAPRPKGGDKSGRTKFGAVMGIEFDYNATDFHLRWREQQIQACNGQYEQERDGFEIPPLTANRTLGALGGIVASRVAREFKLGGPCFTISSGADSGMKALDIAVDSLQRGETDTFLCGCVDMAGDIRQHILNSTLRSYNCSGETGQKASPFDSNCQGIFPSEGAGAVVLKTLDQAQRDGNRIYAVIRGSGTASAGAFSIANSSKEGKHGASNSSMNSRKGSHGTINSSMDSLKSRYADSLNRALENASSTLSHLELYQAHGSGDPVEDAVETEVLCSNDMEEPLSQPPSGDVKDPLFQPPLSCAVGSTPSVAGDTQCVSGLLSIIQASLAIYHQMIPSLPGFTSPSCRLWHGSRFHFPKFTGFWIRNSFRKKNDTQQMTSQQSQTSDLEKYHSQQPQTFDPEKQHSQQPNALRNRRTACVASITPHGTCSHTIMEEFIAPPDHPALPQMAMERSHSTGTLVRGLFVIQGGKTGDLITGLHELLKMAGTFKDKAVQQTASCKEQLAPLTPFELAGQWFYRNKKETSGMDVDPYPVKYVDGEKQQDKDIPAVITLIAETLESLEKYIHKAVKAIENSEPCRIRENQTQGICYAPHSMAGKGKTAFLYPGSGNHFTGMGRGIGAMFPDIMRHLNGTGASLNSRMLPEIYYPRRISWEKGWQDEAMERINSHAHHMIFGQVSFGTLMTRVAEKFSIVPHASIGHSLGETAGLFALRAWNDPEEMLRRMDASDLFTRKLAGEYTAAASAWQLQPNEKPDWQVAAVNRSRDFVEKEIKSGRYNRLYLLIVNTPEESVIGGSSQELKQFIKETGCGAMYLNGVVTVHCPVAQVCKDEYLALHRFPCHPPEKIDFYSCAWAKSYVPETEKSARSILDQALQGFDYPKLIQNAWKDGVRIFLEMGPGNSCTRAVKRILRDQDHLALSLSSKDEPEDLAIIKGLALLAAHGVPVDLTPLFPEKGKFLEILGTGLQKTMEMEVSLPAHKLNRYEPRFHSQLPPQQTKPSAETVAPPPWNSNLESHIADPTKHESCPVDPAEQVSHPVDPAEQVSPPVNPAEQVSPPVNPAEQVSYPVDPAEQVSHAVDPADQGTHLILTDTAHRTTADAHMKFLEFSQENMVELEKQFHSLTSLASTFLKQSPCPNSPDEVSSYLHWSNDIYPYSDQSDESFPYFHSSDKGPGTISKAAPSSTATIPLFDRDMCMEFATGLAGNVLGEQFHTIDTCPVRVRLPDEPLMLVDRIMAIEGEMLSLTSGKIITQHDVKPGAWYLDGGKTPVSISIEAGQADLFLCSFLGIDHAVRGKRRYRLLDARVTFHRTLPEPGETIEYHIEIDRFLKQGDVYLFFFHYKGYIGEELLISMRDGCAGFFTLNEVKNSGGIILKDEDTQPELRQTSFVPPVPVSVESYSDEQVERLRHGDLETAFGTAFGGMTLGRSMRLPSGRMHLIDRVLALDPKGGRFGLGFISAEADIHPDDWFLTCHFVDDMVMPGTLMYECCAHALRIFTQRAGWVSPQNGCYYDIIPGTESDLKCRGPVTRETQKARYEIEIKEIGYGPEPYVIADAHMFSDDHRIVLYKNMGMKIAGLSRSEIERIWSEKQR